MQLIAHPIIIIRPCWKCKKEYILLLGAILEKENGERCLLDFGEWMHPIVRRIKLASDLPPLSACKEHFSRTEGVPYYSNGCPHCGALFGRFFIMEEMIEFYDARFPLLDQKIELPEDESKELLEKLEDTFVGPDDDSYPVAMENCTDGEPEVFQVSEEKDQELFLEKRFAVNGIRFRIEHTVGYELWRGRDHLGIYATLEEARAKAEWLANRLPKPKTEENNIPI